MQVDTVFSFVLHPANGIGPRVVECERRAGWAQVCVNTDAETTARARHRVRVTRLGICGDEESARHPQEFLAGEGR